MLILTIKRTFVNRFNKTNEKNYRDFKNQLIVQRQMAILRAMPNVLMLPHMAYYTDQAVEDMVRNSLDGAARYLKGEEDPWLIGEKV